MELAYEIAMIQCQNCGQGNSAESQFCRFCGTRFLVRQPVQQGYDHSAPRPYSWKTDEYQTQAEARQPVGGYASAGPLATADPRFIAGNYRCPNCMSQFLPRVERRISTTGWILFAAFLLSGIFFWLFWVGLLIKEEVYICPSCGMRVR